METFHLDASKTASIVMQYPNLELQIPVVFNTKDSLKAMEVTGGVLAGKIPYSKIFTDEIKRMFKINTAVNKFR